MVITGPGGSDFDQTISGISLLVGASTPLAFGDWTPTAGGETYTLTLTLSTVTQEGDVCNNVMTANCLAITGAVDVFEDFEANNGGFTGSPTWQYGTPSVVGPTPYSGTSLWGTILDGNYPVDSCDSLRTPAYTVPDSGGAMVVYVWYATEEGWDGFNIKMSVDGGPYEIVTPIGGYDDVEGGYLCPLMASLPYFTGANGAWIPKAVELSAYAGQSVSFSFDFGSDGSVVDAGAYLDDFTIYNYFTGPEGCVYIKGDINNSGIANGIDVVYGVVYFKGGPPPPVRCDMCPQTAPFYAAGDVNGTCVFNGIDITFYVNYLKGIYPALLFCPTCPPAGGAAPAIIRPGLKVNAKPIGSSQ